MKFTHLHVHTHYSLLDGLSKIPELLQRTKELGMDSLAITDHGNMYGAVEFYNKAKELGIKPIIGCELYVAPRRLVDKEPHLDNRLFHLTALVKNETGYKNLIKLVSISHLEGFYYKPRIDKEVLAKYHEGIIFLSGCQKGEIAQAILDKSDNEVRRVLKSYLDIIPQDDFYLELQHHPESEDQKRINQSLLLLAKEFGLKPVLTCDTHYIHREDKNTHEVLLAVQTSSDFESSERFSLEKYDLSLIDPKELIDYYQDTPEIIENTQEIVAKCDFNFWKNQLYFPCFENPNSNKPNTEFLRDLVFEKFPLFYNENDEKSKQRLEYELSVIEKTGFVDYFLIIHDIVNFCRENKIPFNTRGSAAGSMVSFLLGISSVDPIKYDLYFERFLNPDRISPPDIDLDVADKDRSRVLEYIAQRYHRENVAQIITFGIMKARLAVRDVTRALGLPYSLGDQISKMIPMNLTLEEALSSIEELKQLYNINADAKRVIDMSIKLEGVARHVSTHAAGVVISPKPLVEFVPLQHSSRSEDDVITQYSKDYIESLGLLKIDILGLANLTIIKQCLRVIRKVYDKDIDLDALGFDDPKVFATLRRGETIGVFQVESSSMRRLLSETKIENFEDLAAILALYRPGPMEFIPQYISNKLGLTKPNYLDKRLEPIFGNTYGIMVYQEQLMRLAHDLAGFTLSEADILRKAVGKKNWNLLIEQKDKLINGLMANGFDKNKAEKIWNWIEPFVRYGFNKAHAVSYARLAYQTAWLKTYYPTIFLASLLTADYANLDRIAIEINECRRMKIKVLPPSVNYSFPEFGVDKDNNILFGLAAIKNVGDAVAEAISEERKQNGEYKNLEDFLRRLPSFVINKKSLESLIKAGALDCFGERTLLADSLDQILDYYSKVHSSMLSKQSLLFNVEEANKIVLKQNKKYFPEEILRMKLQWEKELLGIYISDHPMNHVSHIVGKTAYSVSQINNQHWVGHKVKVCGVMSNIKKVLTKKGETMVFAKLSDSDNEIELIVFPGTIKTIEKNGGYGLAENQLAIAEGRLDKRQDNLQLICENILEVKEA